MWNDKREEHNHDTKIMQEEESLILFSSPSLSLFLFLFAMCICRVTFFVVFLFYARSLSLSQYIFLPSFQNFLSLDLWANDFRASRL